MRIVAKVNQYPCLIKGPRCMLVELYVICRMKTFIYVSAYACSRGQGIYMFELVSDSPK